MSKGWNFVSLGISVLLHVGIAILLTVSLKWAPEPIAAAAQLQPDIIEAVALDQALVDQEVEKLKAFEEEKRADEKARIEKAEKELRQIEQQKQQQAQQQQLEQQRLEKLQTEKKALQQQRAEEEKRLADLQAKRRIAEQKSKQAEIAKQKAEQQRLEAEQAKQQAEQQRRKEEQAAQRDAERKRKEAEVEKQRQAKLARQRAEAEQALNVQLAEEEKLLAMQRSRQVQAQVDKYRAAIRQRVEANWLVPGDRDLSVTVMVRLIPGGEVVSVEVVESSGDAIFDRSVEIAVRKASPLPLPQDGLLFDQFKMLRMKFSRPE